ncbi:hypothetical protein, partial [Roseicyclus sp.]|uniref:hypothetical protein n=1 Tax=Roseicyclus sp. TaxID=1914329 RepID=UPI003F9FB88B
MPNFRTKIRTRRNLRTKIAAALLGGLSALPATASQPVWQPAIYCAGLEEVRADILRDLGHAAPAEAGTPAEADRAARTYLRIAAEALDCPAPTQLEAMLTSVRLGISWRVELAAAYGHGPDVGVLPLASEADLVCRRHFDRG